MFVEVKSPENVLSVYFSLFDLLLNECSKQHGQIITIICNQNQLNINDTQPCAFQAQSPSEYCTHTGTIVILDFIRIPYCPLLS